MTLTVLHGSFVRPAVAQDDARIAAVINEEIVSNYDVDMRLNLVLSSTGSASDPEERRRMWRQILDSLVDEKLQVQEARENEITVTNEEIDQGVTDLADQNDLTRGQFEDFMLQIRSDVETIRSRVQAELMWQQLVSRQLAARLYVSDAEVQGVLDRMQADAGKPEYQIAEIVLTVGSPDEEAEVKRSADRLIDQLRNQVPFSTLARQFSESATSALGGDVGWVPEGQLAPEIVSALQLMRPGRVTPPIRTVSGYNILHLRDRRKILTADPMDVELDLMQIVIDISADALPEEIESLRQLVGARVAQIAACDEVADAGKELNASNAGGLGKLKLGELPFPIVNAVDGIEVGRASKVVVASQSMRVFIVCDRKEPEVSLPDFDAVEQQLTRQRLSLLARRYMRDLRRDAIVDYK